MLNISGRGILCQEAGAWQLRQDSGKLLNLQLPLLDGHYARIVLVTEGELPHQDVADLENEASRLREFLTRLGGMLGKEV